MSITTWNSFLLSNGNIFTATDLVKNINTEPKSNNTVMPNIKRRFLELSKNGRSILL